MVVAVALYMPNASAVDVTWNGPCLFCPQLADRVSARKVRCIVGVALPGRCVNTLVLSGNITRIDHSVTNGKPARSRTVIRFRRLIGFGRGGHHGRGPGRSLCDLHRPSLSRSGVLSPCSGLSHPSTLRLFCFGVFVVVV